MESTSNVFSYRVAFFYLVTAGWYFDISNVRIQSIKKKVIKNCRREPGRDGKILSDDWQDGNFAAGGIGNLAR